MEKLFKGIQYNTNKWIFGGIFELKTTNRIFILDLAWFSATYKKGVGQNFQFAGSEIIPKTKCQFTGILDKNGNKIFEGDILKIDDGDEIFEKEVEFRFGGFCFEYDFQDGDYTPLCEEYLGCTFIFEIIGNIHDNQLK